MALDKLDALKSLSFGQRVAEEEIQELARYFVQTDQWRQLYAVMCWFSVKWKADALR
jgi:hypothetical protein